MQDSTPTSGTVYWITGLAGSGKTTVGSRLAKKLRLLGRPPVFLDGDMLRDIFGAQQAHSPGERLVLAMRYAHLCRMLANQGFDVVCATISMFPEVWSWNRKNIRNYRQIYLRVGIDVLVQRDQRQIYSRFLAGKLQHVMGMDIPVRDPEPADIVVDNDGSKTPDAIVEGILDAISLKGRHP
ncbi:MAG: adenylyl-sulfate kinase [Magnetococcales bacterium]|nr:adenylyl-sulfate kinase [Magnetococcales bacterium]